MALAVLRRHYGDRYAIHRNSNLWVATDRSPSGLTAPTIIEPTLELFVAALESPGQRVGRPFGSTGSEHPTAPETPGTPDSTATTSGTLLMSKKCSMCKGDAPSPPNTTDRRTTTGTARKSS
ncbi:hypothetical protein BJF83_07820 [Nocardiopsis sp. CNR-923]|nr:hypothetical protein BJF83_07820 [Nocardiopsis sp. CNR-923]